MIVIHLLHSFAITIFTTTTTHIMAELQKKFASEVKGLDDAQGVVEAYANAYNNKDSDGDISHPSSFVKTVSENFKKIRVLKNHNTKEMIGVPKEINALDPYGLFTVTQFNMQTALGRDMYHDVKLVTDNGQEADLSIGYRVLKRDTKNSAIITEYSLKEYSFLTAWGANSSAIVRGLKSAESVQDIIEQLTKMYNLPYSDSRLMQVEGILKSLTVEPEHVIATTQSAEPMIEIIKSFRTQLNTK